MSVQKTPTLHYAWYPENADPSSSSPILAYTVYLNGVEEGGETEFLYQGVKIKPQPGKLLHPFFIFFFFLHIPSIIHS